MDERGASGRGGERTAPDPRARISAGPPTAGPARRAERPYPHAIASSITDLLRDDPPALHGAGEAFFGLAWPALEWLEKHAHPGMATLETGTGASTIVFAAAGTRHVAVSPSQDEHDRIAAFCDRHGIETSGVQFRVGSSDEVLMDARSDGQLDLVLVDGAHLFPFPALDWFLCSRRLRVGGHVVLDDAFLPSVSVVVRFLRQSPSWSDPEPISYRTVAFRKLDEQVGEDATGTRFDRFPRFGYLPPGQRAVALARHALIDRNPTGQRLVARLAHRWSRARRAP